MWNVDTLEKKESKKKRGEGAVARIKVTKTIKKWYQNYLWKLS